MPDIAIVILNWNGKAFLEVFLSPLLDSIASSNAEVVVADNGSTDGSVAFLQEVYPQLRLILFDRNHGFTGGYNKALQQIEAKYYILLNSDIEVDPNWLKPLADFMEGNAHVGICMPKMLSLKQPEYFEYAGACGGFIDRFGYPFCRGRILSYIEKDTGQYDTPLQIFWASGACLMIRAALFHELGGFDERFFAHMEEIDLCWRAQLAGHQVWVVPASKVFHVGGGTLPSDAPQKLYLNYRNNLWMLYKNLPKRRRFVVLASRILFDYLSAFVYLIQGKPVLFLAVWRAHCHFWKRRKTMVSARKGAINRALTTTIWDGSIVLGFFLHRKNPTFDGIVGKSPINHLQPPF